MGIWRQAAALQIFLLLFLTAKSTFSAQAPAATAGAERQPPLVLRGGTLIDGSGRAPLANAVIVISNGRILRVGAEGTVAVPDNAAVIDTTGKTMIPGLVDAHVHLRDFFQPVCLYWGVTTVGDLGNFRSWVLREKKAVEEGASLGPNIWMVGNGLDIPSRARGADPSTPITDERSLETAILEEKRSGADAIKIFTGIPTPWMKLAVEIAHREGLPVFAHYSSPTRGRATTEILDTGLDMHVHTFGLEKSTVSKELRERIVKGEFPNPQYLMDSSEFPPLAQKMVDRKMFLNPTLGGRWARISKDRQEFDRFNSAFWKSPVAAVFPEEDRRLYGKVYRPYSGDDAEIKRQSYRKIGEFIKVLVDRGGKVVPGSDESEATYNGPGGDPRPPGIALHVEMQMLHEVGLTPMQILQAATLWSAQAWRKDGEIGSVEVGKRADLVVLNRNPLDEIAATRDIQMVVKSGQIVDRNALADWKDTIPRPYEPPRH